MSHPPRDDLSLAEARRIALAAQGLDRPRPKGRVDVRHVRRVLERLAVLQLDYVNVLGPAHHQVLFSRLGPYDRSLLDDLAYRRREFTEQWAHEASIVPTASWPLLRHRMATRRVRPYGFEAFLTSHPAYARWVLEQIRLRGPLSAEQLDVPDGTARRIPGAWVGTVPRATLEAHFGRGRLAVALRRPDFVRVFDLAERVIPPHHYRRRVGRADAQRELIRQAARAHGVGTAPDLADYFRMSVRDARLRVRELVAAGDLREVSVEGWAEPAYVAPRAQRSRGVGTATLLSPFDPLVWHRDRVARLFGFDYRIEIFVPEAKRRWGYYVLPFLLGDRLVARVDLKAERKEKRLRVRAAYTERGVEPRPVAHALAAELATLAAWHDLAAVTVDRRGNLARPLAAEVRRSR